VGTVSAANSTVSQGIGIQATAYNHTFKHNNGSICNNNFSYNSTVAVGVNGLLQAETSGNSVKNVNTGRTYSTVQAAVNAASAHNTLQVSSGTYIENVVITMPLTLEAATGANVTIKASNPNYAPIEVNPGGSGTIIKGFTIQCANSTGIYLYYVNSCNITGNTIINTVLNNDCTGIYIYYSNGTTVSGNTVINTSYFGIDVDYSNNSTVSGNSATGNCHGVHIYYSNGTTVSGNILTNNENSGIAVDYSNNSTISGNTVTGNYDGICIYYSNGTNVSGNSATGNFLNGIEGDYSNISIISGNTATNNSQFGIGFRYSNTTVISGNTVTNNKKGIIFNTSNNNIVSGNTVTNNEKNGIEVDYSKSSNISGNIVTGNYDGICIYYSNSTIISGNNITLSVERSGIELDYSADTNISNNNITRNLDGIYSFYSINTNISNNRVTDNDQDGIYLFYSNSNSIYKNDISGNKRHGIYIYYSQAAINFNRITWNWEYGLYDEGIGPVNATNNWWGTNNPTISTTSMGDIYINGKTVDYDPWLILTANSSYLATGNAEITADLTQNNQGEDTSSQGTVPDGIQVDFGMIDTVYTRGGKATAILYTDAMDYTYEVLVFADNQEVYLTINVFPVCDLTTQKGFTNIQDAINDYLTCDGDTIVIASGTYGENIYLYKQLTLMPVTGGTVTIQSMRGPAIYVASWGSGSTIQGFTIIGNMDGSGISLYGANDCNIIGNTIINYYNGIEMYLSDNNVVSGNIVAANMVYGIRIENSEGNNITQNIIVDNDCGISISNSDNIHVTRNEVLYGFSNGIINFNSGITVNKSSANISFNWITGNSGIGLFKNGSGDVNATNNWWGSNNLIISSNFSTCDISINGNGTVTYDPYIILTISSSEYSDGTSKITADLTHDNHGNDTSSSGNIPDGIPVDFNTTFGTIETTLNTNRGKVTSTLNSNTQHGTANVTVTVDNQTIFKTIYLRGIYDTTTNNGYNTIQDAINDPSTCDGDVIEITDGTYNGIGNVNVTVTKNILIEGSGTVILDAQCSGNAFTIVNGNNVLISNIIFKNGNVGINGAGGAIYNLGNLTVTGCTFINNTANWGGAICNNNILNVTNCTFIGNLATHDGGAINSVSVLTVKDSVFLNNSAQHVCGAIINWQGNMNITSNVFVNNTAALEGSAIGNYYGTANINFNRILTSGNYGLYNANGGVVNATNNWWGSNNDPTLNPSNIYNRDGTVNCGTWLVLNVNVSTINSGGNIRVTADLTHNNRGEDTSSQGNIPDGTPVNFYTNDGAIISSAYTSRGKATTILNINSPQPQNTTVTASLDNQNTTTTAFVTIGSATLNITSTSGLPLSITYTLPPLTESVTWISVLWINIGEFTEQLEVIVNGNVVLDSSFTNRAYLTFKNSFPTWVFDAIVYVNQNLPTIGSDPTNITQFWDNVKLGYGLDDAELQFVQDYHLDFIDNLTFNLNYPGVAGQNITITDPENGTNISVNFPGNNIQRTVQVIYANGAYGGVSAGYEGVKSFALAETKVTADTLQYWLNHESLYDTPGALKAAYGTFLAALLVEYCHDQVADQAASAFNVTWDRTSPIVVSAGDDAYQTYVTLECDQSMGMAVVGAPLNMVAFRYACSSVIPSIESGIMGYLGFSYQFNSTFTGDIGSVLVDMGRLFSNGSVFDIFEQNGLTIIKAVGNDSLLMVFDPITGIVRDINLVNGYSGAYCYSNYQTILADDVGNFLSQFNINETLLGMGGSAAISMGIATILVVGGPVGWAIGGAILVGGLYSSYCAEGLNEGWTNEKWFRFGVSVGLSAIPYVGFEAGAGRLCIEYAASRGVTRTVTNTISKDAEGYVLTSMPKVGDGYMDGYITTAEYIQYGNLKGAVKVAFGRTKEEAATKVVEDKTKEAIINTYIPESDQYDSSIYDHFSNYLII